jgi:hypothetical protein
VAGLSAAGPRALAGWTHAPRQARFIAGSEFRPVQPRLSLPVTDWDEPIEADLQAEAIGALEAGQVLFFPALGFAVSPAERAVLSGDASDGKHKNLSFDPATGACRGTSLKGAQAALLAEVMGRYADSASALVRALLPPYAAALDCARTSFRPAEIAGRQMPWRKDDTRLHVDAFPTRPMHGRRILRVFANADPSGVPRRWLVGEDFEAHATRFLAQLRPAMPGSAAVLATLGLTKGRRSAYDHLMLQLHDAAKRDMGYQEARRAAGPKLEFPPGTAWMVFTDQVPHAALAGRHAFEQTFHLPPAAMADPARAPIAVLERLTGRALA